MDSLGLNFGSFLDRLGLNCGSFWLFFNGHKVCRQMDATALNKRRPFTGETALHWAAKRGLTRVSKAMLSRADFKAERAQSLDGIKGWRVGPHP